MKKYLLFLVLFTMFCPVAFATNLLKGKVVDTWNLSEPLSNATITVGENSATSDDEGFLLTPFTPPTVGNPVYLSTKHDDYVEIGGYIELKSNGKYYYDDIEIKKNTVNGNDIFEFKKPLELLQNPKPIVSGKIVNPDNEPLENAIIKTEVVDDNSFSVATEKTDANGKFTIMGYRGTADIPRKYNLKITHKFYFGEKTYPVEVKAGLNELVPIELKNKTRQKIEEENMKSMTGFGCSDLMPRYLVGANCQESRKLKGDATDIALWIQKFGGMITSVISFIAVLLIIWNAFNLVTAAGDTEKISAAKKGLIWTIVGLALTMFAYIIVKTIIMLTYTQ